MTNNLKVHSIVNSLCFIAYFQEVLFYQFISSSSFQLPTSQVHKQFHIVMSKKYIYGSDK